MKSEERHELKENSLQFWLQYGLWMFLKKNGSYVLLAAALVLLGYQLIQRHRINTMNALQKSYNDILGAEYPFTSNRSVRIQSIIDESEVKTVQAIALRDLGVYHLQTVSTGTIDLSPDAPRVNPEEANNKAQAAFDRVVKEFPDVPLAVGPAKLGLGAIAENRGQWDVARKIYEELTAKGSHDAATSATAAARLKKLPAVEKAPTLAALAPPPSVRPTGGNPLLTPYTPDNIHLPGPVVIPPAAATQSK